MAPSTGVMSGYFEIRWHGRGGQGAVTGAKSLAECVQGTGRNVVAFPEYGPERRGAPVKAFNRFSDRYIRIHTPVTNRISHKLFKREIPNSTMLGAFARIAPHIIGLDLLKLEAKHVFSELLGADLVDKNLQAIQQGHDLCHIG